MNITDIRDSLVLMGAEKLALAVSSTLGPKGRSCLLDKGYGIISASNDGFEISKVINLADEDEKKGAELLKEAAIHTHERAGDGCSGAVVIAHSIIKEGVKNIQAGASPVHLGNGLKKALDCCLAYLERTAEKVSRPEQLFQVACTAAKDEQLISEIKDVFQELNQGKIVSIEESTDNEIRVEKVSGMSIDNGYISPYFVRERDCNELELENVYVLMTEKVISDFRDIIPIIEMVEQEGASLLILSAGLAGEAHSNLLLNVHKKGLKAVAVCAGGYGVSGSEVLADAAVYTGGRVIGANEWDYVKSDYTYLGKAKHVKVKQNGTYIMGGSGDATAVNEYVFALEQHCREEGDKSKRLSLRKRMTGLSDERFIIKVGGRTNAECHEAKLKLENAFASAHSAYNTGTLPGGGVAFLRCIPDVLQLASGLEGDERTGALILAKALEMPAYGIIKNAGLSAERLVEELKVMDKDSGYDVLRERFCNMYEEGIVDAAGGLVETLTIAVSVASVFLTAKCFVVQSNTKNT